MTIKTDEDGDIRVDDARDCCGIPIWWKNEQWRKKHAAWVATLTAAERALWLLPAPPQWVH